MPYTGGASPSPERYGGAPGGHPLLQRVYESLAAQRGSAYDQSWPVSTIVAVENMAMARAITFDGYGANERLANNFLPAKMTAVGLLGRWEKILNVPPLPGDAETTRRLRVAGALARIGQPNSVQPFLDLVNQILGPIFVGVTHSDPSNALSWWPGNSGSAGAVTSKASPNMTVTGLTNVPKPLMRNNITLGNCTNAVNNGTFMTFSGSPTSVVALNRNAVAPDYGIGGTIANPTIQWSITNPFAPWYSSILHIAIQTQIPAGYGSVGVPYPNPNGLWWQSIYMVNQQLDQMLPSWVTWAMWMVSSRGVKGFRLDEKNLDVEAFGS